VKKGRPVPRPRLSARQKAALKLATEGPAPRARTIWDLVVEHYGADSPEAAFVREVDRVTADELERRAEQAQTVGAGSGGRKPVDENPERYDYDRADLRALVKEVGPAARRVAEHIVGRAPGKTVESVLRLRRRLRARCKKAGLL
jgi:hypothetical protein